MKAGSAPKFALRNALVESAEFKEHYLLVFISNLKKKFKVCSLCTHAHTVASDSGSVQTGAYELLLKTTNIIMVQTPS